MHFATSRRALILGVLALAIAPAARASETARALYRDGDFLAAAAQAEADGGADDLALAARALLALCVTQPDRADVDALITRAIRLSERALSRDPASVPARLQLAAALGMRGRRASIREAMRAGYAPRGRRLIEEAIRAAPDEPWAQALLGGWHLEVLRRGGRWGALLYGARLNEGMAAFDRARALAPQDPAIAVQYGAALLALDARRYASRAASLFSAAGVCVARDALERYLMAAAERLNAIISQSGALAAQSAAARVFP
jgi:hypothetical protein